MLIHMSTWTVLKDLERKKLPDKKCFYSLQGATGDNCKKLDGHRSDEDYLTCNKIWNEFNMKNIGDCHDYYLKKDVLLLADVFEKFIDMCLKFYNLDPCHYFSSPGLTWDAMLKMTGVKLEKISDIDMYWFIEKGLRGGISYTAKRYSKANNKYMKNYDPTKPSIFIPYLDINNFYGCGMNDCLPYGRFKWIKNTDNFDVNSVSKKSPIYILKSWSRISWWITFIMQWLSISSRKTCNSLWPVRLLLKNCRQM